jgi:inner membrane protein
VVATLWLIRDYEHRRAVQALEAQTYNGADAIRASAYPDLVNPFHWYGVVEAANFFALLPVEVDSSEPEVDPANRMQIRYKPEETPITLAAKSSYLGRVYLDWAKYPVTEAETLDGDRGYIVNFQDLRFVQLPNLFGRLRGERDNSPRPLGAGVRLNSNLQVVGDVYGSGVNRVTVPEP